MRIFQTHVKHEDHYIWPKASPPSPHLHNHKSRRIHWPSLPTTSRDFLNLVKRILRKDRTRKPGIGLCRDSHNRPCLQFVPADLNIQPQMLQPLVNIQSTLSAAANSSQKNIGLHVSAVLAPGPVVAPICILCRAPITRQITRTSNRNGNAGRPYYKCIPCNKFHCFDDRRGNDPTNPPCFCGISSKRQLSGPEKPMGRMVHYVCRIGGCNFYSDHGNTQQKITNVNRELVELLARLSIIWGKSHRFVGLLPISCINLCISFLFPTQRCRGLTCEIAPCLIFTLLTSDSSSPRSFLCIYITI